MYSSLCGLFGVFLRCFSLLDNQQQLRLPRSEKTGTDRDDHVRLSTESGNLSTEGLNLSPMSGAFIEIREYPLADNFHVSLYTRFYSSSFFGLSTSSLHTFLNFFKGSRYVIATDGPLCHSSTPYILEDPLHL